MNYQISVTQECNLNCTYCFENKKDYQSFLDSVLATKCCNFILSDYEKRGQKSELGVNITGGEPLIRFEIVKQIITYLLNETKKRNIENVKFEISTNATLITQEVIDFLNKEFIALFIGSDGLETTQNMNRRFVDNTASYSLVKKNLQNLFSQKKLFFEKIILNMVVTPKNVQYIFQNYTFLYELTKQSEISISIAFELAWELKHFEIFRRELKKINKFYLKVLLEKKGMFSLLITDKQVSILLSNYHTEFSREACGAGIDVVSVVTDGNLLPCGGFIYNKNSSKELIIGSIETGVDEKAINEFRRNINFDLSICRKCDFLLKCNYYCPVYNLRGTGNMNIIPFSVCELNKIIIVETEIFIDSLYRKSKNIFSKKYQGNS